MARRRAAATRARARLPGWAAAARLEAARERMVTRLCQLPLDTPLQLRGMSVAAPDGDTPAAAAAAPPPHVAVARGLSIRISVEGAAEEVLTSRGCGSATRTNVPTVREKEERMEGVKQRRAREALDRAQVQRLGHASHCICVQRILCAVRVHSALVLLYSVTESLYSVTRTYY